MGHFQAQEAPELLTENKEQRLETEPSKDSKVDEDFAPRKRHKCPHEGCQRTFKRPSKLEEHLRQHTGEKPFKCTFDGCDKTYHTSSHLKRHVKQSHESVATSVICTKCSMALSSRESLSRHYNRKHNVSRLSCPECGKSFKKKNNLAEHMILDHTGESLSCDKCSKQYRSSYLLAKHKQWHEKTYACTEPGCNAVYQKFTDLRKHKKTTHVREYKCTECEKTFAANCLLRSHMKAHTNLLIPCPIENCHKTFSYQRNLDVHVRSVHMNIKVYCDICQAGYSSKPVLARHIEVVHMGKVSTKTARKKDRKKRKDAGEFKKSMVTKLSGVELPHKDEIALLKRVPKINETNSEFPLNAEENLNQANNVENAETKLNN